MRMVPFRNLRLPGIAKRLTAIVCFGAGIVSVQVFREPAVDVHARFVVSVEIPREEPDLGRDLTGYDRGGFIEPCLSRTEYCLQARDQARQFIYNHWKS